MRWYQAQTKKTEEHRAAEKAFKETEKEHMAKRNKATHREGESQTANPKQAKKAKKSAKKPGQTLSEQIAPTYFEDWTTTDSEFYQGISISVPDTGTCHSIAYGKYSPIAAKDGDKHGRDPKYPDNEAGNKTYAEWPADIRKIIRRHKEKQDTAKDKGKAYSSPYAPPVGVAVKVMIAPELPDTLLAQWQATQTESSDDEEGNARKVEDWINAQKKARTSKKQEAANNEKKRPPPRHLKTAHAISIERSHKT